MVVVRFLGYGYKSNHRARSGVRILTTCSDFRPQEKIFNKNKNSNPEVLLVFQSGSPKMLVETIIYVKFWLQLSQTMRKCQGWHNAGFCCFGWLDFLPCIFICLHWERKFWVVEKQKKWFESYVEYCFPLTSLFWLQVLKCTEEEFKQKYIFYDSEYLCMCTKLKLTSFPIY